MPLTPVNSSEIAGLIVLHFFMKKALTVFKSGFMIQTLI